VLVQAKRRPLSDAERKTLQREREDEGRLPLRIDIDLAWLPALVEAKFLSVIAQNDKAAVGEALSRLLDRLLETDVADLVRLSRRDHP
jgi:hypothetical protein